MSDLVQNELLAAADGQIAGLVRHLKSGEVLEAGGAVVTFPLTAVVRIEVGSQGSLAGWETNRGAVGLIPQKDSDGSQWIVHHEGTALVASRAAVDDLRRRSPIFSEAVIRWLANSREEAMRIARRYLEDSAQGRVVWLLTELAGSGPQETFTISQQEIARLLGLQRTTVCGAMTRLRAMKVIQYTRGRVTAFDPERLRTA